MKVERISWNDIKNYWIEVNHFDSEPNKKYVEIVRKLGPIHMKHENPRCQAYGLINNGEIIGATQFIEWDSFFMRFRTINIKESYRGRGLASKLILDAYEDGWQNYDLLFGWLREDKQHLGFFQKFQKITPFIDDDCSFVRHCGIVVNIKKWKEWANGVQ